MFNVYTDYGNDTMQSGAVTERGRKRPPLWERDEDRVERDNTAVTMVQQEENMRQRRLFALLKLKQSAPTVKMNRNNKVLGGLLRESLLL